MSYGIEKKVPLPPTAKKSQYPFADMEVGDSFWAHDKTSDQLSNATSHWRDKNGWKFSVRAEEGEHPETGEKVMGARCWRTA